MEIVPANLNSDKSKRCTRCGEVKTLGYFYRYHRSKDGRTWYCKVCTDEIREQRRVGDRVSWQKTAWNLFSHCSGCDLWKESATEFYQSNGQRNSGICKECTKKINTEYYHKNRHKVSVKECNRRQRLRNEMIVAYGKVCQCCGESQTNFLTLEHVNGGGKKHQAEVGGSKSILIQLKQQEWPKEDFTLLCFNCNCAKGFYGACPHNSEPYSFLPQKEKITKEAKVCPICGQEKLIDFEFGRNKHGHAGPYCRSCATNRQRERRRQKRKGLIIPDEPFGMGILRKCPKCDLWKQSSVDFHKKQCWCKSCMRIERLSRSERLNEAARESERRVREEAILEYGGKCSCCGITDPRFLTFDHINGNGAALRRAGERTGARFAFQLKQMGYPKDYCQLLCWNCNCARRLGVCPHKQ